MELSIALGLAGWLVLIVGAALFGIVAQFVGDARSSYEWADGLAIVPALIGGLVVGLVVAVATRLLTGGHSTHGAMSA